MKYLIRFSLGALLVLLLSVNSFAQGFEGVLQIEISSVKMGDSKMTLTTYCKGDKSMTEMNMPQGNMKMYMDQKTHKSIMVMEAMKMGMEMDMDKAQEKKKNSDDASPTVQTTGETKIINGHSCELYKVTTTKGDQSNWWMTKDVPKSMLASLKNIYNNGAGGFKKQGPGREAIEAMFKKGLAPIQIEMIKEGKIETTMTFVKFEEKDVEDSMFKIPDGITVQKMPNMGGGE